MKQYNKKIEVTRVFKHFILEWEDADKAQEQYQHSRAVSAWPEARLVPTSGTEVYDDKEQLLNRIRGLL